MNAALAGMSHQGQHSEHHHALHPNIEGGQGYVSAHTAPKDSKTQDESAATFGSESDQVRAFTTMSPEESLEQSPAIGTMSIDSYYSTNADPQMAADRRRKDRSFNRRSRADSSSSSESGNQFAIDKHNKKVQKLKDKMATLSSKDMRKVLRMNEDLTKQHNRGDGLGEGAKLNLFRSAVRKVIASNRFSSSHRKDDILVRRMSQGGYSQGSVDEAATAQDQRSTFRRRKHNRALLDIDDSTRLTLQEKVIMQGTSELAKKKLKFQRRSLLNGIQRFFSEDETGASYDDFDAGVNSMALLCGLVLGVPYQVLSSLDYSNLDWLKAELALCPKDDWQYNHIYTGYRMAYTGTVYFSISGMVFATFYFLFKRNDLQDFLVWRRKARWMVVIQFFTTAMAMISLILLTNLYFEFFLINTESDICDTGSGPYVGFGMGLAGICFVLSFYLIW
jgi:hypothetical protein